MGGFGYFDDYLIMYNSYEHSQQAVKTIQTLNVFDACSRAFTHELPDNYSIKCLDVRTLLRPGYMCWGKRPDERAAFSRAHRLAGVVKKKIVSSSLHLALLKTCEHKMRERESRTGGYPEEIIFM